MKVLNNFLSGTAMAATAEAVAFGVRQGLDMKMILDVVNASSGRNTATTDKFPNRVLTGTWDAGFHSTQLDKDLGLYRDAAEAIGASRPSVRRCPTLAAPRSARAERGHLARLPVRARCAPIDRRGVTGAAFSVHALPGTRRGRRLQARLDSKGWTAPGQARIVAATRGRQAATDGDRPERA